MLGLRAAGQDAEAINLPGTGEDTTPLECVMLDLYAKRVCEAISVDVLPLLVGHRMGGMAISQAAARCPGGPNLAETALSVRGSAWVRN